MKFRILIINVFLFLLFLFVSFKPDVIAQSCGGSQTCCPAGALQEQCSPINCIPGDPGCFCDTSCLGGDITQFCGFSGNSCQTGFGSGTGCDYLYGACVYTPPAAVCGNGTCESGESNSNCPGDCPVVPPPGDTACGSGDCFTGISNCGEVGRPNNTGSCTQGGVSGMCCGFGGGGGASGAQGAYAYCQDGAGPIYPLVGIHIVGGGTQVESPYGSGPEYVGYTGTDGKVMFTALPAGYWYGFNIYGLSAPTANPLSAYVGRTLSTGQSYTNLTWGDNGNMLNPDSCSASGWAFTHCGPGWGNICGWHCYPTAVAGVPGPVSVASAYKFERTTSEYRMIFRFSNCSGATPTPAPASWFQAEEGDVITDGNITSTIPATCTIATGCNPYLILDGLSTRPGNALYGNLATGNISPLNVSSKGWLTKSTYTGKTYDYDYFDGLIPASIIINDLGAIAAGGQAAFGVGGNISPDGYYWYRKANGTLNINGGLDLGDRKVVVLVDNDVNVRGDITVNNGSGFFMLIASGDIDVDSAVTELEGIYVTDDTFHTGSGNIQLITRGSVVAWSSVNMQRNLGGVANGTQPSHLFEYDPPTMMLFPKTLMQDILTWKEVQP